MPELSAKTMASDEKTLSNPRDTLEPAIVEMSLTK
jgi:hypothetical protein